RDGSILPRIPAFILYPVNPVETRKNRQTRQRSTGPLNFERCKPLQYNPPVAPNARAGQSSFPLQAHARKIRNPKPEIRWNEIRGPAFFGTGFAEVRVKMHFNSEGRLIKLRS
ncbi:MAG TPA: hypothetical protein VN281_15625, partial [Verrucomicrobiae bacterium]|nr:hypothetical protein [Verrucomicrobiae bacterium]